MYLKLFPKAGTKHSNTFSRNEVLRIQGIFTTWVFPGSDLFGPYELLNFTLVGPYANSKHFLRATALLFLFFFYFFLCGEMMNRPVKWVRNATKKKGKKRVLFSAGQNIPIRVSPSRNGIIVFGFCL